MEAIADKRYRLILADPPWPYENKRTGGSMQSGAVQKYDTMTLDEIKALPVPEISEKACSLFLWVPVPLLPDGLEVMGAWGFKYKHLITWRKIMSLGMGFWFRGQVELLLLGIRGKVKAYRSQHPNFIQTRARRHSQKPDEVYGIIESLNIEPRIELFARHRREGWDAWGNQVPEWEQKLMNRKW